MRTAREWREDVSCAGDYIDGLCSVVKEGYDRLPAVAHSELSYALDALDRFDRAMAKLDAAEGSAGGRYRLERVER